MTRSGAPASAANSANQWRNKIKNIIKHIEDSTRADFNNNLYDYVQRRKRSNDMTGMNLNKSGFKSSPKFKPIKCSDLKFELKTSKLNAEELDTRVVTNKSKLRRKEIKHFLNKMRLPKIHKFKGNITISEHLQGSKKRLPGIDHERFSKSPRMSTDLANLSPGQTFRQRVNNYGRWYLSPKKYSDLFNKTIEEADQL